jgi:hypothetical protein
MAGETDLATLLRKLHPVLDETEFGFGLVPPGAAPPADLDALGTFQETEGTTVIAPSAKLESAQLVHTPGWARITLQVHSALSAVGLTAAVTAALAEAGISANVVAAYHHDHVFVPWSRKDEAMEILNGLSRQRT